MAEETERESGAGADGFEGGGDVVIVGEVEEEGEDGVAKEDEGADEGGMTRAGFVLVEEGIFAPVEAVFDAGPVSSDEAAPLRKGSFVGFEAAEVVAGFPRFGAGLFASAVGLDDDDAPGEGEPDAGGFDGGGAQGADFESSVSAFRLGKRGG